MNLRAVAVTLLLTFVGAVLIVMKLGPGRLPIFFYLAALGGSAVWLLPGPLALAIPAGAFGGVLLHAS